MAKSSKKTPQQRGHEFQDLVQKHLLEHMRKAKSYTMRLYDTKSAGNYLPSQPGDFISIFNGLPILVEAKSSGKVSSLSENRAALQLFDNEQLAKSRLWIRAGGSASAIFQCQHSKKLEVWDMGYLRDCFNTPRLRADTKRAYLFPPEHINLACLFMLKGRMA
ncbi:MAG: hypothetical protein DRP42_07805 [Tenericutes bacterium]|nr:MAG: hypothetical protein DRP42_07805 [Mycoplasmatota bacterium]